jgi:hypothetical protein
MSTLCTLPAEFYADVKTRDWDMKWYGTGYPVYSSLHDTPIYDLKKRPIQRTINVLIRSNAGGFLSCFDWFELASGRDCILVYMRLL